MSVLAGEVSTEVLDLADLWDVSVYIFSVAIRTTKMRMILVRCYVAATHTGHRRRNYYVHSLGLGRGWIYLFYSSRPHSLNSIVTCSLFTALSYPFWTGLDKIF